jgi:excinuclease ABC subunit C
MRRAAARARRRRLTSQPPKSTSERLPARPMFDAKPFLAALPNLPGVYRMIGATGDVIYVGKARDLKKRVSSYFQRGGLSPRIELMVSQVDRVETTVTRSEVEALLLESNLIKSLNPRFNVLFKDDKSYPYIMFAAHEFPQVRFYRGSFHGNHRFFGPFPNAGAVRESIGHLQRVFRLRTCGDNVFRNRSRPCLLHQIKRCSGPCVGLVDAESYRRDVDNAALFLQGKENEILRGLTERMQAASDRLEFEQAAHYRDQIQSLQRVLARQFVSSGSARDADVIAVYREHGDTCLNLVMIRAGQHLGDRSFFPANADGVEPGAVTEAFMTQHYGDTRPPGVVIVNAADDIEALAALLSERAGSPVQVLDRPTGERRTWLDMALANARLALGQRRAQQAVAGIRLQELQEVLGLPGLPNRIECFDISHTMGEAPVASCVVCDRGAMKGSEYRRYNITGVTAGDDYGAMRSVLARRYRNTASGEGATPDLILIDGGRGQVNVAAAQLADLGLGDVPMVGVAKGEERKPGLEQIVFPDREETLSFPKDSAALLLIQQIRDEAHRFAITGHRQRRGRARNVSSLEEIPGIGAKRRQKLLERFGGLKGVLSASVEDLALVEGISRALAQRIWNELHQQPAPASAAAEVEEPSR